MHGNEKMNVTERVNNASFILKLKNTYWLLSSCIYIRTEFVKKKICVQPQTNNRYSFTPDLQRLFLVACCTGNKCFSCVINLWVNYCAKDILSIRCDYKYPTELVYFVGASPNLHSCRAYHSPIEMNSNDWKRNFGHVHPAMIQISLRIRAVWSESSRGILESQGGNVSSCGLRSIVRLCGWTRWSESSLGAHVRRYVYSCCVSIIILIYAMWTLLLQLFGQVHFLYRGCLVSFYYYLVL